MPSDQEIEWAYSTTPDPHGFIQNTAASNTLASVTLSILNNILPGLSTLPALKSINSTYLHQIINTNLTDTLGFFLFKGPHCSGIIQNYFTPDEARLQK